MLAGGIFGFTWPASQPLGQKLKASRATVTTGSKRKARFIARTGGLDISPVIVVIGLA